MPELAQRASGRARSDRRTRKANTWGLEKMLAQNLRWLEADGIVMRKYMSDLSLHIEYELNENVRELVCRLLDTISETGATYIGLREKQDLYPLG